MKHVVHSLVLLVLVLVPVMGAHLNADVLPKVATNPLVCEAGEWLDIDGWGCVPLPDPYFEGDDTE